MPLERVDGLPVAILTIAGVVGGHHGIIYGGQGKGQVPDVDTARLRPRSSQGCVLDCCRLGEGGGGGMP